MVGVAITVMEVETEQLPIVYTTVAEPTETPVTIPPEDIVAEPVPLEIDHVPPPTAFVKAGEREPVHTVEAPPPITEGATFIVKDLVTGGQLPTVYTTVTFPAVNPVTTPPVVILAVPVPLTIDQTPPDTELVNAGVVAPVHTAEAPPAIAAGGVLITTVIEPCGPQQPVADNALK